MNYWDIVKIQAGSLVIAKKDKPNMFSNTPVMFILSVINISLSVIEVEVVTSGKYLKFPIFNSDMEFLESIFL